MPAHYTKSRAEMQAAIRPEVRGNGVQRAAARQII